jgi:hypothetical protein
MKLDCVLTAVNDNPLYIVFIPFFVKTWNLLYPQVDVKIVLIAAEIPENIKEYETNIILFQPPENMSTSFISQYIRLLYPCILNYENGVLITDMDMLPMNRTYYTETIAHIPENKFVYYRESECMDWWQISMCYNVATPTVWKEVFQISSLEEIRHRLIDVFHSDQGYKRYGWATDQYHLYNRVLEWHNKTSQFVALKESETKFCRLDRSDIDLNNETVIENIRNGLYTDYHCLRPFKQYEAENNKILETLLGT